MFRVTEMKKDILKKVLLVIGTIWIFYLGIDVLKEIFEIVSSFEKESLHIRFFAYLVLAAILVFGFYSKKFRYLLGGVSVLYGILATISGFHSLLRFHGNVDFEFPLSFTMPLTLPFHFFPHGWIAGQILNGFLFCIIFTAFVYAVFVYTKNIVQWAKVRFCRIK